MKVDSLIESIVIKACNGEELSKKDIIRLLETPREGMEHHYIMGAADYMTRSEAGNGGVIAGQIGLNVEPCSKNCAFCAYAESTTRIEKGYRLTEAELAKKVQDFVDAGANFISLMATGDYPFEEFVRMSKVARPLVPPKMMLSANIDDFGPEEARTLRKIGYGRVYHVIRLGEGEHTGIDPERRVRTLEAAAVENLEIAFCIEPVGPEHTPEELADKMIESVRFLPTACAAMRRIPLPGSPFEDKGLVPECDMALIIAVLRLVHAHARAKTFYIHEPSLPGLMAGANQICAETAANPRELDESGESHRGYTVARCRSMLFEAGYELRKEPNFPGSWYKAQE